MNRKPLIYFVLAFAAIAALAFGWQGLQARNERLASEDSQLTVTSDPTPLPTAIPSASPTHKAVTTPSATPAPALASQVNLDVPFTSQSPYAKWSAVDKEACEEASILMAAWYAQKKTGIKDGNNTNLIPRDTTVSEIQGLVDWQNSTLGYWEDTNAEDTLRILQEKLGVKSARLLTNITADSLKRELSDGNVIVVPAAGRVLKNPHFKQPGPAYHMLTIRGYDEQNFITNDPGIRQGDGFTYTQENLLDAIHDWNGSDDTITSGRKVAIVVEGR